MDRAEFDAAVKKLTKVQREALDTIGCGIDTGYNARTWKALERVGLIDGSDQRLGGRFPITIRRYEMPIHVHINWCAWCSERVALEDVEKEMNQLAPPSSAGTP